MTMWWRRTTRLMIHIVLVVLLELLNCKAGAFSLSSTWARKLPFLAQTTNRRSNGLACAAVLTAGNNNKVNGDVTPRPGFFSSAPDVESSSSNIEVGLTNATKADASSEKHNNNGVHNELIKLTQAPQLSFDKYMTMQDKRVVVTIRYSGDSGLKPFFLTVAKKLKASHPDVMIERRILADAEVGDEEPTFEVLVDGRIVLGRGKKQKAIDVSKARSVFVSMQELDLAISRARRKRRPATAYGGGIRKTLEPDQ